MPEARDRLSRQEDIISAYSQRQIRTGGRSSGRDNPITFVLEDEHEDGQTAGTPFRWRGSAVVGAPGPRRLAAGRGATETPRIDRTALRIGRENVSPAVGSGRPRGRRSVLPTWYPRRPLNDITGVIVAIERRRERQRVGEGLQTERLVLQDLIANDPSVSTTDAQLEHDVSMISPHPTVSKRCCPPTIGKVPKILLDITNHNDEDSACLTPQKKLLDNIDTIEKVVMEELRKLKKTPSAKKAEREKRVRTLMSMR